MFQRPTIIESILERVERTHHISRPDIHEVVSSLDRLDRELSKDDLDLSSCKRMRNNDIGAYPGTKSHSSKDLFVSPAYSVGCGENNVTWKCDTLPDVADLSLPFPMEELHPEGRKCKTIRYPLTPDQIQCFVNNRLFDRKVRTTTEIISCLFNQYGRMSLLMVHFAVCLEPDQTNRRRTFRKSIRECLDNKSMYLREESAFGPVYWLRGSPVILPTPIAQRRFFGNLLDGVQLPIQDSYVPSKLLLPKLPTTIQK
jgi:hypothetical protein